MAGAETRTISLQDLKWKFLLSDELLDTEVSDEHLRETSRIISDHKILGHELGLTSAEITALDRERPLEIRRLALLKKWKQTFAWKSTYRKLIVALLKCCRADDARKVCEMLAQRASSEHHSAIDLTRRGSPNIYDMAGAETRPISLQELKMRFLLSDELLDTEVSDEHLRETSRIISDHKILGHELGLTSVEMTALDQEQSLEHRRLALLKKWKQTFVWKSTYRKLIVALLKCCRADNAQKVCEMLAQRASSEHHSAGTGQAAALTTSPMSHHTATSTDGAQHVPPSPPIVTMNNVDRLPVTLTRHVSGYRPASSLHSLPQGPLSTAGDVDFRRALVTRLNPYVRKAHPTGQELGSGTYGSVIELESAGEVVAGKVFKTFSGTHKRSVLDKLCGEMILMMQINHPNVVESKGVCFLANNSLPVLLMEKLMSSLHAYLLNLPHRTVEYKRKVSILCDVANGLFYLHSHVPAIIHRDLTTQNVLLDSNLKAKIGDFGNARLMDLDPKCAPETFTSLPGTLEYMPPEAHGKHMKYDPSLDVFSFGHLTLITLIQSHVDLLPPTYFDNDGVHAHSEVKRREQSIDTAEKMLGAMHALVLLIKRCLHNNPAQRPHTEQIVTRLQQMTSVVEGSKTSHEEKAPEPKRMRLSQSQLASSSQELKPTPPATSESEFEKKCTSSMHPLDAEPSIKQLLILQTKSGESIDIKTALAADWKEFGFYFDFDKDGSFLNLIETRCGKHKPVACYQEMMREWIAGRGEQPASWRTLQKLLREFGKNTLAKDIEDALSQD